ncbi:helicase III/ VV D5-type ATPase N-terminus [Tupanvirus deep ocean]|uniref:Helicase III/ VV D5-type ATPase N-terminus n=2 Tax=Tupanvirus TaxID=2094720 RepID=A0AC62AAH4_9VIRU|nr:helicase III/ VV D5-type ATPase N-terminus [Tupanvirus deep ocean]QKU34648.1 helicase III/ VV D5-type ATPase N-terminus [Tupanvirus deep ocean]
MIITFIIIKNMNTHTQLQSIDNSQLKLYNFMKKYITIRKSGCSPIWTHSMTYEPYGSYNIPDDVYDEFIQLYSSAISDGFTLHITEKHKEFGPIVIDLDFIQAMICNNRCYTIETIEMIIETYNCVINKYLDVNESFMEAYVLEKEKPTLRSGRIHDGIHIIYPHICTTPSIQMDMRKDFIKLAQKNDIFKNIPLENSLDDVFDKCVIYNCGWMMYASTKNPYSPRYNVTRIYRTIGDDLVCEIPNDNNTSNKEYVLYYTNLLSCRRFNSINNLAVQKPLNQ